MHGNLKAGERGTAGRRPLAAGPRPGCQGGAAAGARRAEGQVLPAGRPCPSLPWTCGLADAPAAGMGWRRRAPEPGAGRSWALLAVGW